MEIVLVMAASTILLMVLAFLSLTREDRELAKEDPQRVPDHRRTA
ncbi:hypothetical protein DAERI_010028 [Deinococcus aerius]|uniref:Uncharacterized protein n=1 Tax=Deinococcus aerius TaxID=200253 RepID=A0A2I9D0L6_9DEIO|nr:hypothetical protein [Deinococcus aerius]GBF03856.1 hypothetical protein DAERI_010028 [Deinococcus aerius]